MVQDESSLDIMCRSVLHLRERAMWDGGGDEEGCRSWLHVASVREAGASICRFGGESLGKVSWQFLDVHITNLISSSKTQFNIHQRKVRKQTALSVPNTCCNAAYDS